jgi:hypothetical protein
MKKLPTLYFIMADRMSLYSRPSARMVGLGGGGGFVSPVGDHILQEFNSLYLTRFRTCKISRPPKQ